MANDVFSTAQRLAGDALIALYTLDGSAIGAPVYTFSSGTFTGPVTPQLITNPCCTKVTTGWKKNGGAISSQATVGSMALLNPIYALDVEGSGYIQLPAGVAIPNSQTLDAAWWPASPGFTPATAGLTYEFQALVQAHRCRAYLVLAWYTAGGGYIGETPSTGFVENASFPAKGTAESDYTRLSVRAVAPPTAAGAFAFIRLVGIGGFPNASGVAPIGVWSKAQLGSVPVDSVQPVPFSRYNPVGMPSFNGVIYQPAPIEADGFEWSGRGPSPRPTLRIANIGNLAGALAIGYSDMLGAKLTRVRTFVRYLDGMPNADPGSYFEPDIWYFDRKASHNPTMVEWELASVLDQEGRRLPGRQMLRDVCSHSYRKYKSGFNYAGVSCPYVGSSYFTTTGTTTGDPSLDSCGRRLSDCRLRFPSTSLPTRAFPGMALDPR